MRTTYAKGTWLDAEDLAYPSGAINAGRRARAVCPDGKVRVVRVGVPDTFSTIPGAARIGGRYTSGFVTVAEDEDGKELWVTFTPFEGGG